MPKTSTYRLLTLLVLAGIAVSGCDSIRNTLGGGKKPPDEFTVLTKAPLILPPDFGLRPPEPGAPPLQSYNPRQQAMAAVTGVDPQAMPKPSTELTPAETMLLAQLGASRPDPAIRRLVNEDLAQFVEGEKSIVDSILFWRGVDPPGTIVDPDKEAARLQAAQAAGVPPTTGETPSIRRRERGLLEGIF